MLISVCKRKVAGIEMVDYWYRLEAGERMEHPAKAGKKDDVHGPCVFRVRRDVDGRAADVDRYPPEQIIPVS